MENATVAMTVIDVMVLQSPVNSASKSVLLTKKTKMANFYAGYAPCLTRGLWYEQSSPVGLNIAEFSKQKKQTKTEKKGKKKRGTNTSITKNLKDLM